MFDEGLTPQDIRAYFNQPMAILEQVEREDAVARQAAYMMWKDQGLDEDAAIDQALRAIAIFGGLDNSTELTGENAVLPWPLKPRVLAWLFRRESEDPGALERHVLVAGSWNALIRAEVRAGRL